MKSKLFFCTDCGWKYMNKQVYIQHWKVKPGLKREPTEEEIFDHENTVTVTIETRYETITEGTRNQNNNDRKHGKETFEDSAPTTIDVDLFELVEDLTVDNDDDDIQIEDVQEVPETSMDMTQQQTMDEVSGPQCRTDMALWDEASSHLSLIHI